MKNERVIMEPQIIDDRAEVGMSTITFAIGNKVDFGRGHLHAPEQSPEELQELSESLKKYTVTVSENAPHQCMDGRGCTCTMAGAETETQIGPKMAGGALQTAFAAAELAPEFYAEDVVNASVEARVGAVADLLRAANVAFGGHTVEGAVANIETKTLVDTTKTGCGAAEKYASAVAEVAGGNEKVVGTANAFAKDYDAVVPNSISKESVEARTVGYGPALMFEAETAENSGANVEVLSGTHGELVVVFNNVEGTTLDRDAFVSETGKQVFWIDVWAINKLAEKMTAGRPDAATMKPKLTGAMIGFQVGVYNELGDGSHPVMVTSPGVAAA